MAALATACVVYDSGPVGPDERQIVEGRWRIEAYVSSSTCGYVADEPFGAYISQNRELLQIVLDVSGFGDVRYDGRLEPGGAFFVSQRTVYPDAAIRDESTVDGRFSTSGRTLTATETEYVTDLDTGRSCSVVWRWRGDRG